MKKVIIILIISLILIIMILGFILLKNKFQQQSEIARTNTELLNIKIAQLKRELEFTGEKLKRCEEDSQKRLDTPVPTTSASPTRATPKKSSTSTTSKKIVPSEQPSQQSPGTPSKANLKHLRDINDQIIFCVMANNDGGMHFPQFALEREVKFTAVQANLTGDGSNWIVEPLDEIEGDYGLINDGTFFVRHDVIDRVLSGQNISLHNLAIKTSFTNWQARDMRKVGDFWIIKLLPNF